MPTKKRRGIIYARPSFLEGMARIFDFGGTLDEYDFGPKPAERKPLSPADAAKANMEALRSDWQAVGDDMRSVMGRYVPDCPACQADADEPDAKS